MEIDNYVAKQNERAQGRCKKAKELQRIETLLLIGGPGEGFMVEAAFDLVLEG